MAADPETIRTVLDLIPQQPPFRFIDSILHLDEDRVLGTCRFSREAFFYAGHFPGNPVTPGVILVEAMAQTGVVALGIFLMRCQGMSPDHIRRHLFLFAFAEEIVFERILGPGEQVMIRGEKIYYRRNQLKTRVVMFDEENRRVCSGVLAGRGMNHNET
ncbi:MAG: 3-hydroxyacyl-ACP dehydratase FabZ family protein [Thermodesulfobacteriota bacterium]